MCQAGSVSEETRYGNGERKDEIGSGGGLEETGRDGKQCEKDKGSLRV